MKTLLFYTTPSLRVLTVDALIEAQIIEGYAATTSCFKTFSSYAPTAPTTMPGSVTMLALVSSFSVAVFVAAFVDVAASR